MAWSDIIQCHVDTLYFINKSKVTHISNLFKTNNLVKRLRKYFIFDP